ncbi:hypothetical protein AGMMS50218_04040 [Actinomycetota bacterium]|nr:hypothetical protein AGMMS50218_04040 [Actinomycetota bacterium]
MTRRIPRRGALLIGATIATVLAVPLFATSASAAGCIRTDYAKFGTNGYARTTDANGQCSQVGAQAGFSTPGISSTIWTGWTYGADVAQSPTVSNLVAHNHSGS